MSSHSWECGEYDRHSQSIEDHFTLASDVIFGRVVSGEIAETLKYGHDLKLVFDITFSAKGTKSGEVELTTYSSPPFNPFMLGGYYVVFLFGNNSVSFCSFSEESGVLIENQDDLREFTEREDIEFMESFREIYQLTVQP